MGPDHVAHMATVLAQSMASPQCRTCECLQGFLTRLMVDADETIAELLCRWRVAPADMHSCCGCDPCPPAALFVDYLREGVRAAPIAVGGVKATRSIDPRW